MPLARGAGVLVVAKLRLRPHRALAGLSWGPFVDNGNIFC